MESCSGIYQFLNTQTGDRYIGSATNLCKRKSAHFKTLRTNSNDAPPILLRAWQKYGEAVFDFQVLVICQKQDLLMYEQILLDNYKPKYNVAKIAGSRIGVPWTQEKLYRRNEQFRVHEIDDLRMSIVEHVCRVGIATEGQVRGRLELGWDLKTALYTPKLTTKEIADRTPRLKGLSSANCYKIKYVGKFWTLQELIGAYGKVTRSTVHRRLKMGWDIVKAVITPRTNKWQEQCK